MVPLMSLRAVLQSLFSNDSQGLVQTVVHSNRRRVVINPAAVCPLAPVCRQQIGIQVPAANYRLPRFDLQDRAITESYGSQTLRALQGFLRDGIACIDAIPVNPDVIRPEAGY